MENAAQVVMEYIFQVIQSLHSTHPITVHNLMDRVDSTAEVSGHCRKVGHDQTCSARQREREMTLSDSFKDVANTNLQIRQHCYLTETENKHNREKELTFKD